MRIKMLRVTVAAGRIANVGDVVDLDDGPAKFLIAAGKAELFHGEIAEPDIEAVGDHGPKPEPAAIPDEAPKRRRGRPRKERD